MRALYYLFSTLLGMLFLAPVAAAQTPVDVARDFFKNIQNERIEAVADLDQTFEKATAQLEALANSGVAPTVLETFVDELVRELDRRAKQGVRAIRDLRAEGMSVLEQMLAPQSLIKRIDRAGTQAAGAVEERRADLSREAQTLLDELT